VPGDGRRKRDLSCLCKKEPINRVKTGKRGSVFLSRDISCKKRSLFLMAP
jgi:hypothetical protein